MPPHISNADIDDVIAKQESQYQDLKRGTEKTVLWHSPEHKTKTEWVFVYLHGYSASRQEISPVCETLAQLFQANCFFTRLTGHGRSGEAMREITVNTLLSDALEAVSIAQQLGNKIILVGTSTGATLATWLALESKVPIHSLIFLSPNFGLKPVTAKLLNWPWPKFWVRLIQGKYYAFTPENEAQQNFWTTRYPSEALIPLVGLLSLVLKMPLNTITTPCLALYCPEDKVIDVQMIKPILKRFASNPLQIEKIMQCDGEKNHIVAGNILSPSTTPHVIKTIELFIKNLS